MGMTDAIPKDKIKEQATSPNQRRIVNATNIFFADIYARANAPNYLVLRINLIYYFVFFTKSVRYQNYI
ncbi:MAG: hypothetical protein ACJAUH_000532 [Saprospiraceae bacterium]|jgi:hypothetical protein|tara:strand:+ start:1029 stop:1235 length:207 start_codon:yes stop_codon:yes gene_type:complete